MSNLFIIGNGFDLAHGLKTSYNDFYVFLKKKYGEETSKWILPFINNEKNRCCDFDSARLLMRLISLAEKDGGCWSDLESSLGKLDYTRFFLQGYTEQYTDLIMKSLEIAIPKIKRFFKDWITKISVENVKRISGFEKIIDIENDYFITFNYTNVLEEIYGVKNICHVHGDKNNNIIFGHGDFYNINFQSCELDGLRSKKFEDKRSVKLKGGKSYSHYLSLNDIKLVNYLLHNSECCFAQRRMINGIKEIEEDFKFFYKEDNICKTNEAYLKKAKGVEKGMIQLYLGLKKDTTAALQSAIKFLCGITAAERINNIFSIGFSYSDVDMKIIDIIGLLNASSWYVNKYRFDNISTYMSKIHRCAFNTNTYIFDFRNEEFSF